MMTSEQFIESKIVATTVIIQYYQTYFHELPEDGPTTPLEREAVITFFQNERDCYQHVLTRLQQDTP